MDLSSYHKEELTISAVKAQLQALLFFLPAIFIFGIPFYLIWPGHFVKGAWKGAIPDVLNGTTGTVALIITLLVGVVVHELIHGITWSRFASQGLRSIRFGVLWKSATPYCHCTEPLVLKNYVIGAAMPGLLMGILPLIVSIFTGNLLLFAFGLFFTLAAGGDFAIINLLRKKNASLLVQDHPSKIGCLIYENVPSAG
ncbi:DUF3267 domain-containing protein [Desertivirga arenae]|uniref:DUF3267 domain-containing protein n=1 Tax=Desertivirga arenae TaxID=2810309 RepID=UPI001A96EB71|nr:DUF3267 domain-containing protein [Pedobacter sp. SYSU D00823]